MRFHVVSHTHWDREWHKTFEQYLVRLVQMMDNLIELLEKREEYKSFMLDGQTSVIEDYLEVRPENRDRLKKLIEKGRIIVGPWYIQPDEFIPSGEALIRNILIGMSIANEFGGSMKIGYLPDSFGQSAQIPQILRGFNIVDVVIWRGISDEDTNSREFWWEAPDGSKVMAHYLPLGYENAKWLTLSGERNDEVVKENICKQKSITDTDEILLLCGYDQRPAKPDLPEIVESLNRDYPEDEFFISNLEDYVKEVRKTCNNIPILSGEFRKGKHMRVHMSIAGTRLDIKKLNHQTEAYYEKYLEPICSLSHILGYHYDNSLINRGWKYIIQNQAHDSIGNVCTDATHKEMEVRYMKALQLGQPMLEDAIENIVKNIEYKVEDAKPLVVFNTLLTPRKSIVFADILFNTNRFGLIDNNGNNIPYQIIEEEVVNLNDYAIESHFVGKNKEQKMYKLKIAFEAELDGIGFKTYYIREDIKNTLLKDPIIYDDLRLENEYIIVKVTEKGTLVVTDKETNETFEELLLIEERGNGGDEYDYSPPVNDRIYYSTAGNFESLEVISNGPIYGKIRVNLKFNWPKFTNQEKRSDELESCRVSHEIILTKGSKRIDVSTKIDNRVYNHRIRALFPTRLNTKTHISDQQFGVLKRNNMFEGHEDWIDENWQEKYYPIYPQQKFVDVMDDKIGFAVLNKGLPQYEILNGSEPTIALTLLSGIDYMGKRDLVNRPGRRSGLHIPTPDSNMIGKYEMEYAILPHKVDQPVHNISEDYNYGMFAVEGDREKEKSILADEFYLIKIDNSLIGTSAIKKCEDSDDLILRIFNSSNEPVYDINVYLNNDYVEDVSIIDFSEKELEKEGKIIYDRNMVIKSMNPNEIITLKICLKR